MTPATIKALDTSIDSVLPGQRRMYELALNLTTEHWDDLACAQRACFILLASGAVTLLPLLQAAEESCMRETTVDAIKSTK